MNARIRTLPGRTIATIDRINGHLAVQDARQRARVKGGAAAEDLLEACHDACLACGVAYVHKVETPYRITGVHGAARTIVYTARPGTDYAGVMLDLTRRKVAVECKSDADPNGPVYLREVKPHQRTALDAAHAKGDVAVLAIVLGTGAGRTLYAVSWAEARDRVALRAKELKEHRVTPGTPYLGWWSR